LVLALLAAAAMLMSDVSRTIHFGVATVEARSGKGGGDHGSGRGMGTGSGGTSARTRTNGGAGATRLGTSASVGR